MSLEEVGCENGKLVDLPKLMLMLGFYVRFILC
jgi:hypothetical protein